MWTGSTHNDCTQPPITASESNVCLQFSSQVKVAHAIPAIKNRRMKKTAAFTPARDAGSRYFATALHAYQKGDFASAEAKLKTHIMLRAQRDAGAHNLLGVVLYKQGRLEAAAKAIQKALTLNPSADVYVNLAMVFKELGNVDGRISAYRGAISFQTTDPAVYSNLANILAERHIDTEVEQIFKQALAISPRYLPALHGLSSWYVQRARYSEAAHIYRQMNAPGFLQFALRMSADWHDLGKVDAEYLDRSVDTGGPIPPPWQFLSMPGMSAARLLDDSRRYAATTVPNIGALPLVAGFSGAASNVDKRLKIGYISADFYNHATMDLLSGILAEHDLEKYEIVLFSYGPARDDDIRQQMMQTQMRFIDLAPMSDIDAAEYIRQNDIDILVDLKGYTKDSRLGISALRPAPVIVSWLGYPGTLGHERLADYIIGDAVVTPPEAAADFSEKIALMPFCYQPNDRRRPLPPHMSRSEAGLPGAGIVFCCFNLVMKINPPQFDIWCRLLNAVPESILWQVDPGSETARRNLVLEAQKRNIEEKRIVFAARLPRESHFARLPLADIALDTYPCNSHTTASDALWAGIPLVTLPGRTFAGRVASSLLTTHGFSELIASDPEDYFDIALKLALDPVLLRDVRSRIDARRFISPLFDTRLFAGDLERLYQSIWADSSSGSTSRVVAAT